MRNADDDVSCLISADHNEQTTNAQNHLQNVNENNNDDDDNDDDEPMLQTTTITDAMHNANGASSSTLATDELDTPNIAAQKRIFLLEPAVFLTFFAFFLTITVYQNQILYQTCTAVFHYNASDCEPLLGVIPATEASKRIEEIVQPYATHIFMVCSLMESVVSGVVSLFIGAWSDRFGRRPIILTGFAGYLIAFSIGNILVFVSTKTFISPWFYALVMLPTALTGGTCSLLTGIFAYVADVTKGKSAGFRMVLLDVALSSGILLGNIASAYLYPITSVQTVFGIATIALLIAFLYVAIFIQESLKTVEPLEGSLKQFFRFEMVKLFFKTLSKRRPAVDRGTIWVILFTLAISRFVGQGESNVFYMFLRTKFDITVSEASFFNSVAIITQICGGVAGMLLLKRFFKFSNFSIALIAMGCAVMETTVRATAVYLFEMYLGIGLGLMRGLLTPMLLAVITIVVPSTEIGSIFALRNSLESMAGLVASLVYTFVYNATFEFYPGLYNLISVALFLICFALLSAIFFLRKSLGCAVNYEPLAQS